MTYAEIVSQHNSELNRPDKVSHTARWIEDTYRDVLSRRKFAWLYGVSQLVTVVDHYIYSLPSDFYSVVEIMFRNGTTDAWPLNILDQLTFNQRHPNVLEDPSDMPQDACITANVDDSYVPYNELNIWPATNSTVYTLDMRYELSTPTLASGGAIVIPSRYHAVLYFGSLRRGFLSLREYDAANEWKRQYEETIARMIADDSYTAPRNAVMQPFRGSSGVYPPSYWKKSDVRGVN